MTRIAPSIRALRAYTGPRPLIASHKGRNSGFVAESTQRAFQLALREGADMIETDISQCKDGMVLMHGPNLDRYMNGTGPITQYTLEELRACRHRTNNGTTDANQLMTLDGFLAAYKNVCLINIDRCFDFLPDAYAAVARHDMADQVLLKSGKDLHNVYEWLEKEHFAPQFMPIINNDSDALDFVLETALYYQYPAVELVFAADTHPIISQASVDRLHKIGIKVWVNALTLNFPLCGHRDDIRSLFDSADEGWGWLCGRGVDVIQTDFVRELKEYLDTRYV